MKKEIYNYTAIFEPAEEGGFVAYVPILPGCVTQGESFEETKEMVKKLSKDI
jgi:predicted RNase H-like HicB family nuclease